MQAPDEDPRSAFVRHLPRKIVEIKATLGAVLADPRQLRMRDELRRRVEAVLTIARAHHLRSLCDGLQATSDALTESRALAVLGRPQLDRLTALVASLSARAELDTRDPGAPGARAMAVPSASRSDQAPTRTLIPGAALSPGGPHLHDLARAVTGRTTDSLVPARGPSAHATQVLFVGSSIRASALLDALGHDADVALAQTADEALARARDAVPDVIVAEDDSPYDGVTLAASVAADPLVRFIPVLVVACDGEPAAAVRARCPEAFDVLESDASAEALRGRIHRALRGSASLPPATAHELGELTLDELIRALQEELRRGLGGAAVPTSRSARVALGAGDEVLAATWEAIARIRSAVERRSGGTVRFELPITPRGLHVAEVFSPGAVAESGGEPSDDPLPGRRALVVDDDPAVVAQFADLLRGAGMIVSAHTDGAEALSAARLERPDVVLADILMPGLDGFALCRAIRRDVALRHTPVILLSWREDLLVRMRELGAQASGYLRKEAEGSAALARVRSTLRGRVRTLKRVAELATGAEVRGRLERVGSVALIESTAKTLGDATISLADSGSVTELEIRQGALLSAVRTAQDGAFARGEAALARALGLNAARFVVRRASHPVRENLAGKLSEVLERSARSVTALEEAVSGAALLEVLRVEFDAEAALDYARSLPTPLRVAVERLVQGDAPREMVLRDGLAPQDLEPLLIELSRRGAIQRVVGRNREDLAAPRPQRPVAAWEQAGEGPAPAPAAVHESVTKVTRPMSRTATVDTLADAVWRELADTVDEPPRPARPTSPVVSTAEPAPPDEGQWERDAAEHRVTRSLVPIAPPESPPEPPPEITEEPPAEIEELSSSALMVVRPSEVPEVLPAASGAHALETTRPTGDEGDEPAAPVTARTETRPAPSPAVPVEAPSVEAPSVEAPSVEAPVEAEEPEERTSDLAFDLVVHRVGRPSEGPAEKPAAAVEEGPVEPAPAKAPEPVAEPVAEPEPLDLPDIKTSTTLTASGRPAAIAPATAEPVATKRAATSTTSQSTSTAAEEPSWTRPLLLMIGVAVALAISYAAVRWYLSEDAPTPPTDAPSVEARDAGEAPREAAHPARALTAQLGAQADSIQPEGAVPGGPAPMVTVNGPYREASRFLDGAALPPDHGVLVIPAARRPGSPVEVSIGHHPVGAAPLHRVLREGFYSVQLRAGDATGNYFIVVRRGLAAVLATPFDR